ncbi:MAG: MoxR family ATPase [Rhodospirillaceae bacterium]|nr:MoxR family ATPase [Rhodospirillaceae bacterium]
MREQVTPSSEGSLGVPRSGSRAVSPVGVAGFRQINELVEKEARFVQVLEAEIRKTIIGQDRLVERALVGLLANGHILLEGVPGLAKTLLVSTIGQAIQAGFSRIQFTPDLLPADLIGTRIYSPRTGEFSVQKGPIFSNLILADEVNRAPAKVQSALLEAMQEGQVTIGDETFPLEAPFLVLATQNPIEQEGTYPLPEAQVDRFMLKVVIEYPERSEEREIIHRVTAGPPPEVQPVIDSEYILDAREIVHQVYVDEKIKDYVLDIVLATRDPGAAGLDDLGNLISFGASPRGGISLIAAARAYAFIKGRGYVIPDDIKQLAPDVLRHRIITTFEAEAQGVTPEQIVQRILDNLEVP